MSVCEQLSIEIQGRQEDRKSCITRDERAARCSAISVNAWMNVTSTVEHYEQLVEKHYKMKVSPSHTRVKRRSSHSEWRAAGDRLLLLFGWVSPTHHQWTWYLVESHMKPQTLCLQYMLLYRGSSTSIQTVGSVGSLQYKSTLLSHLWWLYASFVLRGFQTPSTSVVLDNAATLFYCDAPEMFCGLQNFTWLSIFMGEGDDDWIFITGWTLPLSLKLCSSELIP